MHSKVFALLLLALVSCVLVHKAHATSDPYVRCRYPEDAGLCDAIFMKYRFDLKSKECKTFVYGGCGGNANRFDTKEECEQACGGLRT